MAKPGLKLVAGGFGAPDDVAGLARQKLESSGISLAQAKQLGITWTTAEASRSLGSWTLPGLKLPYFDPWTGKPQVPAPGWPGFFRLRALRVPDPVPDKFSKYMQPRDTGVCAYFPRGPSWPEVLGDYRRTLLITEGELKAAKATLEGYPTIGLGGVNSYQSRKTHGTDLLPELERVVWARREVVICYDSDLLSNKNVIRALNGLAGVLVDRGAIVKTILLPPVPGLEKTGLDDFLVNNHPDRLGQLIEEQAIHLSIAGHLWDLNERYAYVEELDRLVWLGDTVLTSPQALRTSETFQFTENIVLDNGNVSSRRVSAAEHWLRWPLRESARKLVFDPTKPPLQLVDVPGQRSPNYNTWAGWGVQPRAGDITLFTRLVSHLFSTAPEADLQWFLAWCAYPLQHPGAKLFSSVVLHGLTQGTGKSLIGYTLGKIYGKNFSEIRQDDIHSSFNEWVVRKQLVMGDDVTGSDKRQDRDMLKKLITQKELRINEKYTPSYTLPDCVNYLWTSNQPDAFFLEDDDRRFFVHEVSVKPLPRSFYDQYDLKLREEAFPAAVFDFLLNLDLSGFNPRAAARETQSKLVMIRASQSDLGNWVRDLVKNPEALLRIHGVPLEGDLFTNRQLLSAYCSWAGIEEGKVPAKRLWAELSRVGVTRVHNNNPFGEPFDRRYAVRHGPRWAHATLQELVAHLEDPTVPPPLPPSQRPPPPPGPKPSARRAPKKRLPRF